jgi:lipoyl-dependent peroxiredoxin
MMPTPLDKVIYTAHANVQGGRDGVGRTSDGQLEITFSPPASSKPGTNPEQLFALGYAACFIAAMKATGGRIGIRIPDDVSINSSVSLGPTRGGAAWGLAVKLEISLPGLDAEQKNQVVDAAHKTCPYSNATRDNIEVELTIV